MCDSHALHYQGNETWSIAVRDTPGGALKRATPALVCSARPYAYLAPAISRRYTPGNSWAYVARNPMTELPSSTAAERRSLAKWYAAARAALARNRPLTTSTAGASDRRSAADLSAAETAALRSVGAFKDEAPIQAENDPLIGSQAQY